MTTARIERGLTGADVAPHYGAYLAAREELERETPSRVLTHAAFIGRIDGLDTTAPEWNPEPNVVKDTQAIYALEQLRKRVEMHDQEAELREQGWTRVETVLPDRKGERVLKAKRVVVFFYGYVGEGSYSRTEYADARILGARDGSPHALLKKGKRTRGTRLYASNVYVEGSA